MTDIKHTPLYDIHKKLNARFVNFHGWEMPLYYESALKEHEAVRNTVGVFDVSHMGEIEITGSGAQEFIQKITTNNVLTLNEGRVQYSVMCYPSGGIVDDLLVYNRGDNHYLFCVNSSNIKKDYEWIKKNSFGNVTVTNRSDDYGQIAIQGKYAKKIMEELVDDDISGLKSFAFIKTTIFSVETIVSRTGYTGEDGYELYVPARHTKQIWNSIMSCGQLYGISPAGLSARDTLRLEMGYMLYGNDITEDTLPVEAGLSWIVKGEKGEFIGKKAIDNAVLGGLKRKLTGVILTEKGVLRPHCEIYKQDKKIGEITSGTFSPSLKKSVAMAYVDYDVQLCNEEITVYIRGKKVNAVTSRPPFYSPPPHKR